MDDSTTPQDNAIRLLHRVVLLRTMAPCQPAIARTGADRNRTDKAALRLGEGAGNTKGTGSARNESRVRCIRWFCGLSERRTHQFFLHKT